MAPFDVLYRKKCRSPLYWDNISELPEIGPDMIRDMTEKVKLNQKKMKAAQDRQANYANVRRRPLPGEAELDKTLSYVEKPIQILDHKEKRLRTKTIPLVKIWWSRQDIEETT
ncbi:uncharacterized protein [Primulina huaijiensis]|uniref:uncharacterized protein n=1 Tax=Primulina huaijiensis TaxID=1492673 RepID=UPI003CC7692D